MNSGHTCLFHKSFAWSTPDTGINAITLPHSAQRKHTFWGGINQISKSNKIAPRTKLLCNYYNID